MGSFPGGPGVIAKTGRNIDLSCDFVLETALIAMELQFGPFQPRRRSLLDRLHCQAIDQQFWPLGAEKLYVVGRCDGHAIDQQVGPLREPKVALWITKSPYSRSTPQTLSNDVESC